MVIPVPTLIKRGQIHVGEQAPIEHLDAYTAPRLVEYFDSDPCRRSDCWGRWRWLAPGTPQGADARNARRRSA